MPSAWGSSWGHAWGSSWTVAGPVRPNTGKVIRVSAVTGNTLGSIPTVGEPCALLFDIGSDISGDLTLTFIRPDGTVHYGDPDFAYVGREPGPDQFQAHQYINYNFAIGELGQRGVWQVYLRTIGSQLPSYFQVS